MLIITIFGHKHFLKNLSQNWITFMKKYRNHVPSKLSRNTFLRKSLLCPKNVALSNISKFILFDFYSSHGKEIATGTIANVPLAAPLSLRPTDQDHSKHVAFEESSKKTDEDTGMILEKYITNFTKHFLCAS